MCRWLILCSSTWRCSRLWALSRGQTQTPHNTRFSFNFQRSGNMWDNSSFLHFPNHNHNSLHRSFYTHLLSYSHNWSHNSWQKYCVRELTLFIRSLSDWLGESDFGASPPAKHSRWILCSYHLKQLQDDVQVSGLYPAFLLIPEFMIKAPLVQI